jgi:membrane peptidoglycan carboxypeptidase
MEPRTDISIAALQSKYGIKQAAAYKWRTALRNLGIEESWENYDRIKDREINLSEALKNSTNSSAIAVVETAQPEKTEPKIIETQYEQNAPLIGISPQRLAEINATVELEVMVEDALYEHHRQLRRGERAAKAAQKVQEVQKLDPKQIVQMALAQVARVQEIA